MTRATKCTHRCIVGTTGLSLAHLRAIHSLTEPFSPFCKGMRRKPRKPGVSPRGQCHLPGENDASQVLMRNGAYFLVAVNAGRVGSFCGLMTVAWTELWLIWRDQKRAACLSSIAFFLASTVEALERATQFLSREGYIFLAVLKSVASSDSFCVHCTLTHSDLSPRATLFKLKCSKSISSYVSPVSNLVTWVPLFAKSSLSGTSVWVRNVLGTTRGPICLPETRGFVS